MIPTSVANCEIYLISPLQSLCQTVLCIFQAAASQDGVKFLPELHNNSVAFFGILLTTPIDVEKRTISQSSL